MVWGSAPLPYGSPLSLAARWAANRETALRRVRRRVGTARTFLCVHRLAPPSVGPPALRRRLRSALFGGVVIEVGTEPWERVLDAAAAAAGVPGRVPTFQLGSGGAVIARVRLGTGEPAVLRVGRTRSTADPHGAAAALEHLRQHHFRLAPLPLGHGAVAGASWSAEAYLPGRRPSRLTSRLAREVERAWVELPKFRIPPAATAFDLEKIASRLPQYSGQLGRLTAWVRSVVASLPSVVRHGDLWTGNLRTLRGALTGVIDWDSLHLSGVPGADLLQLYGTEMELTSATSLGAVWLREPWNDDDFRTWTVTYWRDVGVTATADVLHAVGVAWWAVRIAGTLDRLPHRANDERWVTANVDAVLSHLRP